MSFLRSKLKRDRFSPAATGGLLSRFEHRDGASPVRDQFDQQWSARAGKLYDQSVLELLIQIVVPHLEPEETAAAA